MCELMAAEKCQKVCFSGQEIVETLYSHYNIPLKGCSHMNYHVISLIP